MPEERNTLHLHFPQPETERSLLAAVVESSDDAIITKDLDGIITSWNRGAEIVFGYTAEEMVGRSVAVLLPEWLHEEEPQILAKIRNSEKVDHYETVRRRKDGGLIDVSLSVSPIRTAEGEIIGASKIARDITSKKSVMDARRKADRLARIVEAEEATRKRISRDLHDHLGQKMTGLRLLIEQLSRQVEGDDQIREAFEPVKQAAEEIDNDLSFISWELRPTELEEFGLVAALRTYSREWSRQFQIPVVFHPSADDPSHFPRFERSIETNIYRVAQEALNNIWKHADASTVAMIVRVTDNLLTVIIEDDGQGFEAEGHTTETSAGGIGLLSMRERMSLIGGSVEIESRVDQGTSIIVRYPSVPALTYDKAEGKKA